MNPAPAEARLPLRPPPRAGSGPIVARPPLHDLDEAERIASKDRSSLYRVSQFFEDPLRYHAFIAMYAVMRIIDDRIDGAGDKSRLPLADRQALHAFLDDWEHRIRCAYAGHPAHQPLDRALSWAVARFSVPLALWTSFLQAMRFDVDCPRFDTYSTFLAYAEGASVAPTTIFVYLMTAACEADGVFRVPAFDYQRCGQHLGRFAYVAHILRDLRIDMQASEGGLVYLAQADLQAHDLDESTLRAFTQTGAADPRFDRLVATLVQRARTEQAPGVTLARTIWPALPVDCHFIFQLIVRTYGELLDRIARTPNLVLSAQPILGPKEQARLAEAVAARTSYPIAKLARATRSPHAAKNRPATPASLAAARTDAAWVLGGASLATTAICCLYPYPLWISLAMAGLLAWFATRWTHPGDRLGFAVGGTLGLLTELLADEGGLWRHANTQVLGLMPAYLLFCYPLLGAAVPRLIRACLGRDRPLSEGTRATGLRALALWALVTTLCVQLADNQHLLLLACALCLGLFLWQFRSPHDRATLLLGGGLGLLWELPCTWTGAWSFPHPQWLGLIPFWLPVAYAVFFGTLGRVTATMVTQWAVRAPAPLPGLPPPVPLPNSLLAPKPEEE